MRILASRPVAVLWLTAVWVVLWESYDLMAFVGGIVVGSLLVYVLPGDDRRGFDAFRPYWVARFLLLFFWQVLQANAIVSWEVLTPTDRVKEGIIAVPVPGASDTVVTLLANVISLTPGTLIIEVDHDPTVLYVHLLHLRDVEQARLDLFRLERAIVLAFGSRESLEDVDRRIAELRAAHPELRPAVRRKET